MRKLKLLAQRHRANTYRAHINIWDLLTLHLDVRICFFAIPTHLKGLIHSPMKSMGVFPLTSIGFTLSPESRKLIHGKKQVRAEFITDVIPLR